jgi:copper chaperone NosL
MKNRIPQILVIITGLLLLLLFVLPMWRITLLAPQYPDGVHMFIYINKIGGATPGTLQNVNILNHYIGMKAIEPDSIAELKYLPIIVIALSVLAMITAFVNKKYMFLFWLIVLTVLFALGLYDFYLWEYDYGHNLDPKAPMKFDDSFQPPLIGSKTIINFIAKSYPHIGGWLVILGYFLSMVAVYLKFKKP